MDDSMPRLGRGLAALIGDFDDEANSLERMRHQRKVPIEFLRPNPRNPRKSFAEDELEDLANSIRERGIIQPILVRIIADLADAYEIIAGERRWRAAQKAGLHEAPIVIVEAGDKEALEIAIIENVQRSDLNALEEAQGYEQLSTEFGYSQNDLARVIGKSRSHVANTLRLLKLSATTREYLASGKITAGHARALLTASNPDVLAKRIVDQGLTVRDIERLTQKDDASATPSKPVKPGKNADTVALEKSLSDVLGMNVKINYRDGRGDLTIQYRSLEQLEAICKRLQAS